MDQIEANAAEGTAPAPQEQLVAEGIRIGAAMVWQDRAFLAAVYPILLIPLVLAEFAPPSSALTFMGASIIERLCDLVFLFIVGARWYRKLSRTNALLSAGSFLMLLIFGFAFWGLFFIPIISSTLPINESLRTAALLILVPATVVGIRYFFYFFPILLNLTRIREILPNARFFTLRDIMLPFRTLSAPAGIVALLSGLVLLPAPDGHDAFLSYLAGAVSGLFWLLSSYLGLGMGLALMPRRAWHDYHLDPYLDARLSTLAVQTPNWFASLLAPKTGVILLVISIFVWGGNYARLRTAPPHASVTVERFSVEPFAFVAAEAGASTETKGFSGAHSKILVTITAEDPEYHMRGFDPDSFNLAGERGTVVASAPSEIATPQGPLDDRNLHRRGINKVTLTFSFYSERTVDGVEGLTDLYLWYRDSRLVKLATKPVAAQGTPKPAEPTALPAATP